MGGRQFANARSNDFSRPVRPYTSVLLHRRAQNGTFDINCTGRPPQEPLPIPDFRTIAGRGVARPSPNLLDTIYVCQERQAWYREFATVSNQDPIAFVGSMTTQTPPAEAAAAISRALGFDLEMRRDCPTWTEALRRFID